MYVKWFKACRGSRGRRHLLLISVASVMWVIKHPQSLVPFSVNVVVFILYFRFIGSDSKLHLYGQRSLALLVNGAVCDFSMWKDRLRIKQSGASWTSSFPFFPSPNRHIMFLRGLGAGFLLLLCYRIKPWNVHASFCMLHFRFNIIFGIESRVILPGVVQH